ncbi:MAG: hypothetical protein C5B50_04205 [Verrucomicrobia bacterium]|nr:MAG: hypothetical protein C5B50_04205 [Verrucomicrobiota bacterium]
MLKVFQAILCMLVVGFYFWTAKPGLLELRARLPRDGYYNLLSQGFQKGQLSLNREAPIGLQQLADPYDPLANGAYRESTTNCLRDLSYYKGKLYLYFGVTPALILFWPYHLLTSHYLAHYTAVAIFLSVGFLAGAWIIRDAWLRYFAEASRRSSRGNKQKSEIRNPKSEFDPSLPPFPLPRAMQADHAEPERAGSAAPGGWLVLAGTLAVGLCNYSPAILQRADVWEVATSCGSAMTMLCLAALWKAMHSPQQRNRWLAAASLAYGLAVGARPSLLPGAVILLLPMVAWREKVSDVLSTLLAAVLPITLIGLGLMLYNFLRFGNPAEFGLHYQLTSHNPHTSHPFRLSYLWFNACIYLLKPANLTGIFPFIRDISLPPQPLGYVGVEHVFGVLSNIPLTWLAAAAPLVWTVGTCRRFGTARSRSAGGKSESADMSAHSKHVPPPGPSNAERAKPGIQNPLLQRFLVGLAMLFAITALPFCFYDSAFLRYEGEFVPPLVLLAVFGMFGLENSLLRVAARCAFGFLLALSLAFNLLASFSLAADALNSRACALSERGDLTSAMACFQKALQIRPDYSAARVNFAGTLLLNGRIPEATAQLEKTVQLDPNNADALVKLGNLYSQQNQIDKALACYERAVKAQPDFWPAHYNLGAIYLQQKKLAQAAGHFERVLAVLPDFAPAKQGLAAVRAQQKN